MAGTGWGSYTTIYNHSARRVQSYNAYEVKSTSDTSATYTVTGQARDGDGSGYYHASQYTAHVTIWYKVGSGAWTQIGSEATGVLDGAGGIKGKVTGDVTVTKTHAAQTVTFRTQVANPGYWDVATTESSVSLGARTSYAVTYSANGGSGAPSGQTKWHGETLALSKTAPTRSLYNFLGWATSSSATTPASAYTAAKMAAGVNYTSNAKLSLYAVWELAYAHPTISAAQVWRASDSSGTASPSGTYAQLVFSWSVDATADGGTNTGAQWAYAVKETTVGAFPSDTVTSVSATSGSVSVSLGSGFAVDKSYDVRVSVTDTHGGTTTVYLAVAAQFSHLDFYQALDGSVKSIGVGTTASEEEGGVVFDSSMPVTLPIQQGTFSIDTTKATLNAYGLRKNGGMGLFTLVDVKLASALAAGSTVVIGRLPEGFRPAGDEFMQCCIANGTAYHNIWSKVVWASDATNGGNVEIRNRSGASFPANVAFSVTIPLLI